MILSPDCLCFARYRGGGSFICKTKQEMNTFSIHMKRHAAGPFTVNDPASMQVVVVGRATKAKRCSMSSASPPYNLQETYDRT